jgi:alpha-tubulin suppressor-like RCC1 family protein
MSGFNDDYKDQEALIFIIISKGQRLILLYPIRTLQAFVCPLIPLRPTALDHLINNFSNYKLDPFFCSSNTSQMLSRKQMLKNHPLLLKTFFSIMAWLVFFPRMTECAGLVNPRKVEAGGPHSCALDDTGVRYWGLWNTAIPPILIPVLKNPRNISVGVNHICAIDDIGVKCWGSTSPSPQTTVPPLMNPRSVSAGGTLTCALDDTGVKCWGINKNGQTNVPPSYVQ